jgi:hypothetical protein
MMKLRTNITLFSLFSFIFFAASLGTFKGLVLCYGEDGHIHTEITFNGVDCGHFPKTPSERTAFDYFTKFNPAPHTNHCICCIDIPLSLDYSLKNFHHTNTPRTGSKLGSSSSPFLPITINSLTTASTTFYISHPQPIAPTLNLIHNTILLL